MQIQPDTFVQASQDCVMRGVGEETLLLHLKNGTYYGLDDTGGAIWTLLENGARLDEILSSLQARYNVDPLQIQNDIHTFLLDLAEHDLIRLSPTPS